jgi:hypothetical protein
MNTSQLRGILGASIDCFLGVFPSDRLPSSIQYPCCLVANTDPSDKPGEHWVCMFLDQEKRGEYFCSFGLYPFIPTFVNFLDDNCSEWIYNTQLLQSPYTVVCGHYCVYFLHYRHALAMKDILDHFSTTDLEANDALVVAFVESEYDLDMTYQSEALEQIAKSFN